MGGQEHNDLRSLPRLALDLDRALVSLNVPQHCRESQTPSRELRREERLEDPRLSLFVHAAAGVRDLEAYIETLGKLRGPRKAVEKDPVALDRSDLDLDLPWLITDRLRRVGDELQDDLPKLHAVCVEGWEIAGKVDA